MAAVAPQVITMAKPDGRGQAGTQCSFFTLRDVLSQLPLTRLRIISPGQLLALGVWRVKTRRILKSKEP